MHSGTCTNPVPIHSLAAVLECILHSNSSTVPSGSHMELGRGCGVWQELDHATHKSRQLHSWLTQALQFLRVEADCGLSSLICGCWQAQER